MNRCVLRPPPACVGSGRCCSFLHLCKDTNVNAKQQLSILRVRVVVRPSAWSCQRLATGPQWHSASAPRQLGWAAATASLSNAGWMDEWLDRWMDGRTPLILKAHCLEVRQYRPWSGWNDFQCSSSLPLDTGTAECRGARWAVAMVPSGTEGGLSSVQLKPACCCNPSDASVVLVFPQRGNLLASPFTARKASQFQGPAFISSSLVFPVTY